MSPPESYSPAAPLTPPIPPKSMLRESASMTQLPPQSATSSTWPLNARQSESTQRTGYDWVPSPVIGEDDSGSNSPVEGEKLAALRQSGGFQRRQRTRGGWGRICLIIGLVAIVVIGLAVGLGVGLTVGRRNGNNNDDGNEATTSPATDTNTTETGSFPTGQYSIVTALKTVNTGCTSNPNTWSCVPNTVYNSQDSSTFAASMAEFHWILSNTSVIYATNGSDTTPDAGVASNLTISTTNNPLSITFSDLPLTYYNPASNSSAERFSFNFSMPKSVIPNIDISGTGTQSRCYFNETTFTGTLYLSQPRKYPDSSTAVTSASGDDGEWPFAIEITQTSPGGETGDQIIPACYSYVDGKNGDLLDAGLFAQSADSRCECGYSNF